MTRHPARPAPPVDLLRQIRDLKRVRDARSPRSLAERQFGRAWARLAAGEPVEAVALSETAAALAAVRLAALNAGVMMAHGLDESEALDVLGRAFDDLGGAVDAGLRGRLRAALGALPHGEEPAVVDLLVRQPRAGATHPGLPRLVLEPAESHADHSFATAVFGVVLAPDYGADPAQVFLTGLAHHLFNASLPDAGHAGDVLIGDDLTARMATVATDRAVATLPVELQSLVRDALGLTREARFAEPEAQAFHAADALDRVLEMDWHARTARFTLDDALGSDTAAGQLDVCHGGFYQDLQRDVLRAAGLFAFDHPARGEGGAVGSSSPLPASPRRGEESDPSEADRPALPDTPAPATPPSGSYERGGHGAVAADSPLAGGPGAEDGEVLRDGTTVAHLERRELGS
ncbi:HD domain-containing protein [Rubrivirga sp. S365]|uniref:HD domain-containing protein n=1 Tax=Rubrivirga sp. S365 TaxID=3076080 RepID=UPI0028CAEA73|nr:HD domain-containing protein [Rubrivirga sp. S365]MDT7855508.1 HD domain-containing protein [Rubrivirga sp. S365]